MFKRLEVGGLPTASPAVTVVIDGVTQKCSSTDTVAAAIFGSGALACRDTAVSGVSRGPYCMMGVCYDCLVEIDGQPNQQACMTRVQDGMKVSRQVGARRVGV